MHFCYSHIKKKLISLDEAQISVSYYDHTNQYLIGECNMAKLLGSAEYGLLQ